MTTGRIDSGVITRSLGFDEQKYADRPHKIRNLMAIVDFDLLCATTSEAVCYLHGDYIS